MDTTTYLTLHEDFVKALHARQLLDAFRALKGQLSWVGIESDYENHARISHDYQTLLQDFRQGLPADILTSRHNDLVRRTYHLGATLHHRFTMLHTQQYRAQLWKKLETYRSQQSLTDTLRYETDDKILFDALYCAAPWTEEVEAANELMRHPNRTEATRATVISAVTLCVLANFDEKQCAWLLQQAALHSSKTLRVRLLVGLVYIVLHHSQWFSLFPELEKSLKSFFSTKVSRQELRIIQTTLLASVQSRHVKTDGRSLIERYSQISDSKNLETQQHFFQEMADFVANRVVDGLSGIDIALSGFKQMYRRYPYFKEAVNWFIPFSTQRLELLHLANVDMKEVDMEHRALGNTDLYILAETQLARKQLLEEMKRVVEQLNADEEHEDADTPQIISLELSEETVELLQSARQQLENIPFDETAAAEAKEQRLLKLGFYAYIHDTYRYFHLFVHRNERENPFRDNLLLNDCIIFHGLLEDESSLAELGLLCFSFKDYAHALHFFQQLPQQHRDVRVRLAQSYHALKQYGQAIPLLEQLVAEEDDESLLYLLAACYGMEQRPEDALVCWIRLAQLHPDDLRLSEQMVDRYLTMQLYGDALDELHKILYHKPEDLYALSAKAQCYLSLGRFAEAQAQYDALLATHPDAPMVLLYAGHCALLSGDNSMAIRLYMAALEQEELHEVPADYFDHAVQRLQSVGFTPELATFVRDLLNSEMQSSAD